MMSLCVHARGRPAGAPPGLASVGAARPSPELPPGLGSGTLRAPGVELNPGNETLITDGQGHPGAERQGQSCVSLWCQLPFPREMAVCLTAMLGARGLFVCPL